jgi:glucuronoarabinoxylan endo-1,4-beta-xylanase
MHRFSSLRTCALPALFLLLGEACSNATDSVSPSGGVQPFGGADPGSPLAQPAATNPDDGSSTDPSALGTSTTGSENSEDPAGNLPLSSSAGDTPAGTPSAMDAPSTKAPGTAQPGDVTIDPGTTFQTMDGFGIADVWQGKANSTPAMLTLLFDPVNGIGLSILRIGIDGTSGQPKIMGDAAFVDGPEIVKYGGKVWAAPWSPPANMKDNADVNNGGHLLTNDYEAWASVLAAFPAYYKQQSGVDLYAISAQNEPDFVANYQSSVYDSTQMNNFIKVLAPKLAALNPPVGVLAAEPDTWGNLWGGDNYGNAILNDPAVSPLVTVIATHDYGSNTKSTTRPAPPAGANMTHRLWETEITYSPGAAIDAGLDIARGIYAAVTSGGVNGWLYWWTQQFMDGGSASNPPKRVYAMGNFSKFVRPGFVRVAVTGAPAAVQIVSFMNPADGTYAIVALNSGTSAQQVSLFVSGATWPSTVTPYVTSASSNLAAGTDISVSGGRFSGSLPQQSITTFVGKQ